MKKIKEYLDKRLHCNGGNVIRPKKNGHYELHGIWVYPKNYKGTDWNEWNEMTDEQRKISRDHMSISINNEKIIVGNMCVNNQWSIYHYLDVYEHLPRGEPDEHGYYQRSTEEEVIKYLDSYYQRINNNQRKGKLKKIMRKINE